MSYLISVIIPAYNSEPTLDSCISSVLRQTYQAFEIILIDDGSTDRTPAICDQYASRHSMVKTIHQSNSGPSAARNAGLRCARGEYIAFVDSDDTLHPDYLKTLVDLLTKHRADVVCVSYQIVARSSRPDPVSNVAKVHLFNAREAISDLLYQKHLDSSQCCKLYRRDIIEGIFFPDDCRVYEDLFFVYQVFCRCQCIAWCDKKMYFYHKLPTGQMDRLSPMTTDAFIVMDRIRHDIGLHYPDLVRAIGNRTISVSFNIIRLLSHPNSRNADIEHICWQNIKALRMVNLLDPNVRIKNKAGVLVSFFGKRVLTKAFSIAQSKAFNSLASKI